MNTWILKEGVSWESFCLTCLEKFELHELSLAYKIDMSCERICSIVPAIVRALNLSNIMCQSCYDTVVILSGFLSIAEMVTTDHIKLTVRSLMTSDSTLCYTCGRLVRFADSAEDRIWKIRDILIDQTHFDIVQFLGLDLQQHLCPKCTMYLFIFTRFRRLAEQTAIAKTGKTIDHDCMVQFDHLPGKFNMFTSEWLADGCIGVVDPRLDGGQTGQLESPSCDLVLKTPTPKPKFNVNRYKKATSRSRPRPAFSKFVVPKSTLPKTERKSVATSINLELEIPSGKMEALLKNDFKPESLRDYVLNSKSSGLVYHCAECKQCFYSSHNYATHERTQHNVARRFSCSNCPKTFRLEAISNYHVEDDHSTQSDITKALKDFFDLEAQPSELAVPPQALSDFIKPHQSYLFGMNEGHADTTEADEFTPSTSRFYDGAALLNLGSVFKAHLQLQYHTASYTCTNCPMFFNNRKDYLLHKRIHKLNNRSQNNIFK